MRLLGIELGPLEELPLLLASEPSLQPHNQIFLLWQERKPLPHPSICTPREEGGVLRSREGPEGKERKRLHRAYEP